MRSRSIIIITTILGLTLAACGGDGVDPTVTTEGEPDPPEGRSGVVLEIRDEGGFVPVSVSLTRLPRFVVFADGTVVRRAPRAIGSTQPFPLFRSGIGDGRFDDLLTFVDDMGLADIDRLDVNEAANVADAPTTTVTYYDESGAHTLGVYALGIDEPTDARAAILQSMIALLDEATLPLGEPYGPDRYEVLVSSSDVNPQGEVRETWPLDVTPDDMEALGFADWRCSVSAAEDIDEELLEASGEVGGSVWVFDGTRHAVLLRPLFPHESACER